MSTTRRTPGVFASPAPKGAQGENLCRNCLGPLPAGRKYHNCSPECSEAWHLRTSPAALRYAVERRDKGICAECGVDTKALQKQYVSVPTDSRENWLADHGIPYGRECTDWWDADHIKPVIEGGGECTLENMRTLCIPCHKEVTAALAAKRAEERKKQKVVERDDARGLFAGL